LFIPPAAKETTSPTGKTVVTVVAISIVACLFVLALFATKRISLPDAPTRTGHDDPYSPDCAIIRGWLKRQYGDVEVISWGTRTITRSAAFGDSVTLTVRFRAGKGGVCSGFFIIGPGDVVESATIQD